MTLGVSLSPSGGEGTPPAAPVTPTAATPPPAVTPPAATPPPAASGNGSTPPPPAGAGGVSLSTPPVAPPAGDQPPSPFASLTGDYKQLAENKGWKSLDDALKSYKELETHLSQTRPVEAPKSVTDYDAAIEKPADADAIGYNDGFAKWLKETGFKHKIPVDTIKTLHGELLDYARGEVGRAGEAQVAAATERVNKAATELTKSWGSPNTPKFARNLDMAMRAINNLSPDLKQALADTGVIANVGGKEMVANHVIIDALAKAGAAMYAEDTLYGSTSSSANPFDPATLDLTKQGQLIRTDKARAASFIRALKPELQSRYTALLSSLDGA